MPYLPNLPLSLDRRSMVTSSTPLDKFPFTLDASGISGFFGGDEAISAMATIAVLSYTYHGRRWLGWYNTPGSYQVAKRYGRVSKLTICRGLFPGVRIDPSLLLDLEFEGRQGPRFQAAHSGTIMDQTGHLASLLMKECASVDGVIVPGRVTLHIPVTIVKLHSVAPAVVVPPRIFAYSPFLAIIPIFVSLAACIACSVYEDWFSFSLILLGVLSNGVSCLIIGSGTLQFAHHIAAPGSPPGDGVLGSGNEFILLQGEESAVNVITRGRFSLQFLSESYGDYIGYCSLLLTIQFIAQLFLIPQGSLFGQIMFVLSLAVSWAYNIYLSTFDKEEVYRRILLDEVLKKPLLQKYILTTHTTAMVFMLCILSSDVPGKILDSYMPNDTKVWREWKKTISQRLERKVALHFEEEDWHLEGYTKMEQDLLRALYGDAQAADDGFRGMCVE